MWIDLPYSVSVPAIELAPGAFACTSVPAPYRFHLTRVLVNRTTDAGELEVVLWPLREAPTLWQRMAVTLRRWLRLALRRKPKGALVTVAVRERRVTFDAGDFHGHLDLGTLEKGEQLDLEVRNCRREFEVVHVTFEGLNLDEEDRRARLQRDAHDTLTALRVDLAPVWASQRELDDE